MKPITTKALARLFEFHRARVTDEDLRKNPKRNQGYGDSVEFLEQVHGTGLLPDSEHPYLWDVVCSHPIGLKDTEAPEEAVPGTASMARYRNFVFSIALGSIDTRADGGWGWFEPVLWFLEDADRTDPAYLRLLRSALASAGKKLEEVYPSSLIDDLPFFTFGVFLLSGWLRDPSGMSDAARQLIQKEAEIRAQYGMGGAGFLWDLQRLPAEQVARLRKIALELQNPADDPDVALVLSSL